jgi:hypothetical protein
MFEAFEVTDGTSDGAIGGLHGVESVPANIELGQFGDDLGFAVFAMCQINIKSVFDQRCE